MKLSYPAIFYPCEEGGYTVVVPDLPGCVTEGDTLAEAILMGIDAASGWVLDELEDGRPAPKASPIDAIKPDEEGGFVNVLALDMDDYAAKYGESQVNGNFTIPAYLNTFAKEQHIDYSKVMQDSLNDMYQRQHAGV